MDEVRKLIAEWRKAAEDTRNNPWSGNNFGQAADELEQALAQPVPAEASPQPYIECGKQIAPARGTYYTCVRREGHEGLHTAMRRDAGPPVPAEASQPARVGNLESKVMCCYMGGKGPCDFPAEWVIVHGPSPEDYTHACMPHVGELLIDAKEHRIYPLASQPAASGVLAEPFEESMRRARLAEAEWWSDGVTDCEAKRLRLEELRVPVASAGEPAVQSETERLKTLINDMREDVRKVIYPEGWGFGKSWQEMLARIAARATAAPASTPLISSEAIQRLEADMAMDEVKLPLPRVVEHDIPRRNRIDLATPVEEAIRAAQQRVEAMPADVRLTKATVLLSEALNSVADYLEDVPAAATERGVRLDAIELAKLFHETYERLAPDFGYKTRKESAVPWEQVPVQNRQLMIAVCQTIFPQSALEALTEMYLCEINRLVLHSNQVYVFRSHPDCFECSKYLGLGLASTAAPASTEAT